MGVYLGFETKENIVHHNNFIDPSSSGSQGYDEGSFNQWYLESKNEGNYWSDYLGQQEGNQ